MSAWQSHACLGTETPRGRLGHVDQLKELLTIKAGLVSVLLTNTPASLYPNKGASDLLLRTGTNHSTVVAKFGRHVGQVLALEHLTDIAKVDRCGALFLCLSHVVQCKLLVVACSIDFSVVEESCMVD